MKTIDDFIKELQSIPEGRRKLPLITYAPNGTETYPSIKMKFEDDDMFNGKVEKMVITWRD